jgi:hypothetical protein
MTRYTVSGVALLRRRALMSSTYKPALLRALIRVVGKSDALEIPLAALGDAFCALYWNQVVVHKLRQSAVVAKEPEVVRWIRTAAEACRSRKYADLPAPARSALGLRVARTLTIDVLRRFHNSRPKGLEPLFTWSAGTDCIFITDEARDFIRSNHVALEMIANYAWAQYLEICNRVTPRVLLKVSGDIKREPLARYLQILLDDGEICCFYCGALFGEQCRPSVDHVIPWSFALEDKLWDLVLACVGCNSAKSDWLPAEAFIEKLMHRNSVLVRRSLPRGMSMLSNGNDVTRLYEVAIASDWPRFWYPTTRPG